MHKLTVLFILILGFIAQTASAIPTEASDALAAQGVEVATYTGPAVIMAVAVATAGLAITWVKRFISKAS